MLSAMDQVKLYKVQARMPTGHIVTSEEVTMKDALTGVALYTELNYSDVTVIDLQTGAEAPMDQFKLDKPDA